jgi:hypothetical protein
MDNEPRTCPRCGIFYYEWLREPGGEPLIPNMHECPEPFSPELARSLLSTILAYGVPVSQTMKARIKLGLEQDDA